MKCTLETPKYHISFLKFVRHFIYNEKNKKMVPFYYLTEEYLMIWYLKVKALVFWIKLGISAHWKTESVMAEIIVM